MGLELTLALTLTLTLTLQPTLGKRACERCGDLRHEARADGALHTVRRERAALRHERLVVVGVVVARRADRGASARPEA